MTLSSRDSAFYQIFVICDNICKRWCKFYQLIPFLCPCFHNHGAISMHSLENLRQNSSVEVNETTKWNTVNWCAPQHRLCSQPCVFLTGRQLCKREELKVVLSPETQGIQAILLHIWAWKWQWNTNLMKAKQFLINSHGLLLHVWIIITVFWELSI